MEACRKKVAVRLCCEESVGRPPGHTVCRSSECSAAVLLGGGTAVQPNRRQMGSNTLAG